MSFISGEVKMNQKKQSELFMWSANYKLPVGIIPRIENQKLHFKFLDGNKYVTWIMVDIHNAEALTNKGLTALSAFGSNLKVITTTTISDDIIVKYHLEKELSVVRAFRPNYHIPCDRPVYVSQNEKERLWIVETYVQELSRFVHEIKRSGVNIIPLLKGVNFKERKICYNKFKELDLDYIAYYSGQYFGHGRGNRSRELTEDIQKIVSESGIEKILLIGSQSVTYLEKLPPQVIAAAGLHQWLINSGLRKVSIEQAQENYCRWTEIAEKTLNCGQDVLKLCYPIK